MAGQGWAEFSYISILIMGLGAMPYLVSMKSRLFLHIWDFKKSGKNGR
jgi:hypothetical protein